MLTRCVARVAFCLGVSWAIATRPSVADEKPSSPPKTIVELQSAIEDVLQETNTPGGGVVLVSKDKILWAAEFGVADRASGQVVTPETMFRAGSISKTLVALAFLKLEAEGKLSFDDRVSQRAGDATFSNPWETEYPLRVVHLLEHTSGFLEQSSHEYAANIPDVSLQKSLAYDSRARVPRWQPGMFYTYSNANYDLAGRLLERITDRSFDDYMENEILIPLGMKDASFLLTDSVRTKL